MSQESKRKVRSASNPPHPRGQQSPAVRAFSFGLKPLRCHQKNSYETYEDAVTAVATKMKYDHKTCDWLTFKAYKCHKCQKYHLAKVRG